MQERTVALSVSLLLMVVLVIAPSDLYGAESCPPKGQVVFSALTSEKQYTHDGGRYDLFLQDVPGGKITRLTNHQANPKLKLGGAIREPLFSPDGKRVLFLADYADSDEGQRIMTGAAPYPYTLLNIWQVTLPARSVSPLTKGELGWHDLSWSPNGRFFSAVYPSKAGVIDQDTPIPDDIYVYNIGKAAIRKLTRVSGEVSSILWSVDSKNVLFQLWAGPNLYAVARAGGKSKILIRGKGERFGYSFSPDNRRVAYVQDNAVYVAKNDGSGSFPAIEHSEGTQSSVWRKPKWSRTGSQLAIAEVVHDATFTNYQTRLHVYDPVGRKDRIVATLQQDVTEVTWSRCGKWLIVKTLHSGNTEKPDPKTGWHTFQREGVWAVSVADGHVVALKEPNEETKGLDWFETAR